MVFESLHDENNPTTANNTFRANPLPKPRALAGIRINPAVPTAASQATSRPVLRARPGLRANASSQPSIVRATNVNSSQTLHVHHDAHSDMMALSPSHEVHVSNFTQVEIGDLDDTPLDPQLVSEYASDIMRLWRHKELKAPLSNQYMRHQAEVNAKMRGILVDWLVEVHLKFKLVPETLFVTVRLVDRFLAASAVKRSQLQLIGITAMVIACKYQEIYPPEVNDFVYISDNAYTKQDILRSEEHMLNTLSFAIGAPSSHAFALRWMHLCEFHELPFVSHTVDYLLELALVDYDMLQYIPSLVSASAVALAAHLTSAAPTHEPVSRNSGYTASQMAACMRDLTVLARSANPKAAPRLKAVHHKYSLQKFHRVSTRLDQLLESFV